MRRAFLLAALLAGCTSGGGHGVFLPDDDGGAGPGIDLAGSAVEAGPGADLAAPPPDLAKPDLASTSTGCGKPGDPGNEIGVGKYCTTQNECTNNGKAILCAVLACPTARFCTTTCQMGGPPTQCGSGAECFCTMGSCACVPSSCSGFTC